MRGPDKRVAVVIATRNRVSELLTTLGHLRALPEEPGIVVVDNGSSDGTAHTVRHSFPEVEVIALGKNHGAAARNIGVRHVDAPYVAFSDDDSWWAPGSLARAADLFDAHPRLGLLAARILIGPGEKEDPICAEMANSPLPFEPDLPGPPVLGFLACTSVVRRSAYLEVGGFDPELFFAGEEKLLAPDLAAAGWGLAYIHEVVAHHHPSTARDPEARRRLGIRNALWFDWLRRPAPVALRHSFRVLRTASHDTQARSAFVEALWGLPQMLGRRQVVPPRVESDLKMLDRERGLREL